jgi:hypothetical protein
LGILLFILLYFANNIDKEHGLLKILCYIYVFVLMILMPVSFFYKTDMILIFYKIIMFINFV